MSDRTYAWNFSPAPDILLALSDPYTALVYGKIARFSMMKDRVCKASIGRIAQELGISEDTVHSRIQILKDKRLIEDLTPDLRNVPHKYQLTNRLDKLSAWFDRERSRAAEAGRE